MAQQQKSMRSSGALWRKLHTGPRALMDCRCASLVRVPTSNRTQITTKNVTLEPKILESASYHRIPVLHKRNSIALKNESAIIKRCLAHRFTLVFQLTKRHAPLFLVNRRCHLSLLQQRFQRGHHPHPRRARSCKSKGTFFTGRRAK